MVFNFQNQQFVICSLQRSEKLIKINPLNAGNCFELFI